MNTATVLTAGPEETDRALATIVMAFGADPPARWVFPDPQQYLRHFTEFSRAYGGGALACQSAHYVNDFAGVALWLPPGQQPDEAALVALLERTVDGERLPKVFEILEQLGQFHPSEPHWYLPMIGVDPARQGKGHGACLLKHGLQLVDQAHLPAYLESTNPANIPLYERHGFEVVGTVEVADAPPFFPMLRKAR